MQRLRSRRPFARSASFVASLLLAGCASPGPPRPPSLQLPRLVSDLAAARSGDTVTLRFTVSGRTTDGQPLRSSTVGGSLCRQLAKGDPCTPVDVDETQRPLPVPNSGAKSGSKNMSKTGSSGAATEPVTWTDVLPAALLTGAPRPIAYRVELRNNLGRSAGFSDPVYTVAGAAPPPVTGFTAQTMRLGVRLSWTPAANAGEVLLQRTELLPGTSGPPEPAGPPPPGRASNAVHPAAKAPERKPSTPGVLWLQAAPGDRAASATLDASGSEGVPYRYVAVRRDTVQVGGRTLEWRSAPSAAATATWRDVYPPPTPTGLTALGYAVPPSETGAPPQASLSGPTGVFAVDLIWQPVGDPRLAGYLVYRQTLTATGEPTGPRQRLTAEPVPTPGFHDATAQAAARYRYSVTAIDPKGNESSAIETVTEPLITP